MAKGTTPSNDIFVKACNERDALRDRLNSCEGPWTAVLSQNRKVVAEYIKAEETVKVWEELLAIPETL